MPSTSSLVYDVILNEYTFEPSNTDRGDDRDEKTPFYASIDYARPVGLNSIDNDNDGTMEHFMSIALKSNIQRDALKRDKLNCVVVLETSSMMNTSYTNNGDNGKSGDQSKQSVANQIVCDILDILQDDDQFCLLSFSDSAKMEMPLEDIKSMDIATVKSQLGAIPTTPGGVDFDEGYNAALNQLQELFDAQIMAAASVNAEDDEKEEELTENRFIFVTATLPESDSSLMDQMQVCELRMTIASCCELLLCSCSESLLCSCSTLSGL